MRTRFAPYGSQLEPVTSQMLLTECLRISISIDIDSPPRRNGNNAMSVCLLELISSANRPLLIDVV